MGSSSTSEKYDVFLSFRGEDTRNTFISHLYTALDRKKIKTYIDEKSLERGDEISPALLEAIEKSKISIIVFSKAYASSSWCLSELAHVLECHKESKQMVIPIFYEVDPSHIRKQEGSYGDAFLKHEARFSDRMDIVQTWRAALTESANLTGWDSKVTRPESKLVEEIVEDVLRKLNRLQSSYSGFEHLVGIDKQIAEIKSIFNVCSPKVRVVGIWGMGGIGKTTLAQVVFAQLSSQFEACCFVENVREKSKTKSLIKLRNKLLAELLNEKSLNVGTPSLLPTFVKERLRRTKVLIVLDDVNHVEQLNSFLGDRDMFSSESRIIITTRDATVLRDIAVDGMYEVKQLDFNDALQLFNLIAFRGNSPITDYIELSKNVVEHAGGIPLAIQVLGSHFRSLRSQSKESWAMEMGKLKSVPHDNIYKALRISYDGLDDTEKDIFLDIACFFKGKKRDYVEKIFNACDFFASSGIDNLIDKSLITLLNDKSLWMHDLLQEMGQNVVCQESKERGERSRLWIAEDARHVLETNEGTAKIQGIFLDLSQIDEDIHLEPTVFQKMHNLRLLKIYNSSHWRQDKLCLQGLNYLPRSLRYLEWHEYPLKYLPSNFKPNNLVELKMPYNQLEQLWVGAQDLKKLTDIDLSNSIHLTQIPDLLSAPNLERINLAYCTSLLEFPLHILRNLNKLIDVNLSHCGKLQSVPDRQCDAAFHRTTTLQRRSMLSTLPMTTTSSLVSLNLSWTKITSLPPSIDSLNNISSLYFRDCARLANLPSSMNKMASLKELYLGGCSILETFPELPWNITWLDIQGTRIKEVASSSIEGRFALQVANLSDCKSLQSLPSSIFQLRSLYYLDLSGCSNLKNLPEILEPMKSLKNLLLSNTGIKELPSSTEHLVGVQQLLMEECKNLESIPNTIYNMISLNDLDLSNCSKFEYFATSARFLQWEHLQNLNLSNSNIMEIAASVNGISNLRYLYIMNCKNLRSLPELPLSLQGLDATGCTSLEVVSNLERGLKQEFWDYSVPGGNWEYNQYYFKNSMFCDSLKLDQQQRHNILIDFHLRVLRWAARCVYKGYERLPNSSISACCPGNEIPRWFEHQSKGSFIDVKLPPEWHNTNFLGFELCVVGYSFSEIRDLKLSCEINQKPRQGKNHKMVKGFSRFPLPTRSDSSNVYMWYCLDEWTKCPDAVEVSFKFPLEAFTGNGFPYKTSEFVVKKCGVHILYTTELEEVRLNGINSYSDAIANEPESSTGGLIDCDTGEPHPKRVKF